MPENSLIDSILSYEAERGGAPTVGTLTEWPLRTIEYYLTRHFSADQRLKTLETGCGASTILFSRYAASHKAYCLDDRQRANSGVDLAEGYRDFRSENVEFVFGPTQHTILERPPTELVDIILINGPRGYPFPELEYITFNRWLKVGGILIVNDIHIPTINNLYRFLCEDDMFVLHSVVNATAFFARSGLPLVAQQADNWWQQRYNVQRFPALDWNAFSVGIRLPINLTFSGRLAHLAPYFKRGFILVDGNPVTEGPFSIIKLPLQAPFSGALKVEISVDLICPEQRPKAKVEVEVYANNQACLSIKPDYNQLRKLAQLRQAETLQLRSEVSVPETRELEIRLKSGGLLTGEQLSDWTRTTVDKRQPGARIRSIAVSSMTTGSERQTDATGPVIRRDGSLMSFTYRGTPLSFFVDRPDDSIQGHHAVGELYESEELDLLAKHVPRDARILDIGANIGNHMVFFEKVLGAKRIVTIECQQRAIDLLKTNASLNDLRNVDFSHLGVAFDAESGWGSIAISQDFNMAGGVVKAGSSGDFRRVVGDEQLANETFDFIKCDVEGAEVNVFRGLVDLIGRSGPDLFVEVWDKNAATFGELMQELGYTTIAEYRRYDIATNLYLRRTNTIATKPLRLAQSQHAAVRPGIRRFLPWQRG
jgi:FkbM family methyltransferase